MSNKKKMQKKIPIYLINLNRKVIHFIWDLKNIVMELKN